MFNVPEQYRIVTGRMGSNSSFGNNGAFFIPSNVSDRRQLLIIASDGLGWEHVSVHVEINHTQVMPYWDEMCYVKDLFWDGEDVVVQFHPKKSEYVNTHGFTLHLWRAVHPDGTPKDFPTPPSIQASWWA